MMEGPLLGDSRFSVCELFGNCKRFALPASAQPSLREGSGTPKSSVGKVRILLKACDRTSSPVLARCSEAVLLGRFEIQNQDYLSCSVPLEKKDLFLGMSIFSGAWPP